MCPWSWRKLLKRRDVVRNKFEPLKLKDSERADKYYTKKLYHGKEDRDKIDIMQLLLSIFQPYIWTTADGCMLTSSISYRDYLINL